ncbi:MAG TPA: thiamine phosphate synthase [Xanthobacteraceae bacterium]|nr:thiamine phosphate synthase [Xanthobacteraceae bacterium]
MNALPSRLLVVTDRHQAAAPLEAVATQAILAGTRWIWLRDRDMPAAQRRALAARLLAITRRHGARLSIGGDVALAGELAADGVHLGAGASVAAARQKLGPAALIGISTHGEAEIAAAVAAGADYATLSPIYPTQSKPGYGPALGVAAIARAAQSALPVLALGGVTAERAPACLRAGAAGIAVMGEAMRAAGRPGGIGGILQALALAGDPA